MESIILHINEKYFYFTLYDKKNLKLKEMVRFKNKISEKDYLK